MEWTQINSAAARAFGYDYDAETLDVEFTGGRVYRYFEVPNEVYERLMTADSIGRFLNSEIVNGGYAYEEVKKPKLRRK
jgi:hypothetical protein